MSVNRKDLNVVLTLLFAGLMVFGQRADADSVEAVLDWKFSYDSQGNLVRQVFPSGYTRNFVHAFREEDKTSSVSSVSSDGVEVRKTFDSEGGLTNLIDPEGETVFERDPLGRVVAVHRTERPSIHYSYDHHGRVSTMRIGSHWNLTYSYDYLGRLSVLETPGGEVTYEYYGADSVVVRRFPNGVIAHSKRDASGKLMSLQYAADDGQRGLLTLKYSYRPDGKVASITRHTLKGEQHVTYAYDGSGQLISVSEGDAKVPLSFRYDKLGNRISSQSPGQAYLADFDWRSAMVSVNGRPVTHDADLNLTQVDSTALRYRDNRVVHVVHGGLTTGYRYDGLDRVIERVTTNGSTEITLDPLASGWNPLVSQAGAEERFYLWEGDVLLATFTRTSSPTVGDSVKGVYHLQDHLGTRVADTDERGNLIETYTYGPFGRPHNPGAEFPFVGFASMAFDSATGTYLTPGRLYNPSYGRFFQPDPELRTPLGDVQDLSPFAYCANDPVNFLDREGLNKKRFSQAMAEWFTDRSALTKPIRERTLMLYRLETRDGQFLKWGVTSNTSRYKSPINSGDVVLHIVDAGPRKMILRKEKMLIRRDPGPFNLDNWLQKSLPAAQRQRLAAQRAQLLKNQGVAKALPKYLRVQHAVPSQQGREAAEIVRRENNRAMRNRVPSYHSPAAAIGNALPNLLGGFDIAMPFLRDVYGNHGLTTAVPRIARESNGYGLQHSGTTHSTIASTAASPGVKIATRNATLQWDLRNMAQSRRTDTTSIEGVGYRHYKHMEMRTPSPKGWIDSLIRSGANMLQMYNPLADYGPGDSVVTQTRTSTRQRFVTRAGQSQVHSLPFADQAASGKSSRSHSFDLTQFAGPRSNALYQAHVAKPVGGIAFADAKKHLEIGVVTGAYFDEGSQHLVLLGEAGEIELPPLRLDDIVTIFRAVYLHGETPWVSIDPVPTDPEGPLMNVVHSPGTDGTYVGWVLFESDRIMKSYGLGRDNLSKLDISSAIDGYQDVLNAGMFARKGPQMWERFWIVPAEVTRETSPRGNLVNLTLPLKVNTQVMIMQNGKLEPAAIRDANGTKHEAPPSLSAQAFSSWFSKHMEAVGDEWKLPAPAGSGIDGKVNVFGELQRLALISAIAETLRDQGVPMPVWMYDHTVAPVKIPEQTPALEVERTLRRDFPNQPGVIETATRRVYGGASLSPPADQVRTRINQKLSVVADDVAAATINTPLMTTRKLASGGESFHALVLPGVSNSAEFGLGLSEVDLEIASVRTQPLRLRRVHSSLARADGALGESWSMDLPKLTGWPRPGAQEPAVQRAYTLSVTSTEEPIVFNTTVSHASVKGSVLAPASRSKTHPVLIPAQDPIVIFADGRRLQFDSQGRVLSARNSSTEVVRYNWDDEGQLIGIAVEYGEEVEARIDLVYSDGRLVAALGSDGQGVTYEYADAGQLISVFRPDSTQQYRYDDHRITHIEESGLPVWTYTYNSLGQILTVMDSDACYFYDKVAVAARVELRTYRTSLDCDRSEAEVVQSTRIGENRESTTVALTRGEKQLTVTRSAGGVEELRVHGARWQLGDRQNSVTLPEGGYVKVIKDSKGQATEVAFGEQTQYSQVWHPDGRLAKVDYGDRVVQMRYGGRASPKQVVVGAPSKDNRMTAWTSIDYDRTGRSKAVRDATGLNVDYVWDSYGELNRLTTNEGSVNFMRDATGLLQSVRTSWGSERHYTRDPDSHELQAMTLSEMGREASIAIENGRVTEFRNFDGAKHRLWYDNNQLTKITTPSGLSLCYDSDERGRIESVEVDCRADETGTGYRHEYEYDEAGRPVRMIKRLD